MNFSRSDIREAHARDTRRRGGAWQTDIGHPTVECSACHRYYYIPCHGKNTDCSNLAIAKAVEANARILPTIAVEQFEQSEQSKSVTPTKSFLLSCWENATDVERDAIIDVVMAWADKRTAPPEKTPEDEVLARWRSMQNRG